MHSHAIASALRMGFGNLIVLRHSHVLFRIQYDWIHDIAEGVTLCCSDFAA